MAPLPYAAVSSQRSSKTPGRLGTSLSVELRSQHWQMQDFRVILAAGDIYALVFIAGGQQSGSQVGKAKRGSGAAPYHPYSR